MERPSTLSGWIALLDRRLRKLERSRSVTVGPWVIETDRVTGALVARNITTGTVTVISPP